MLSGSYDNIFFILLKSIIQFNNLTPLTTIQNCNQSEIMYDNYVFEGTHSNTYHHHRRLIHLPFAISRLALVRIQFSSPSRLILNAKLMA